MKPSERMRCLADQLTKRYPYAYGVLEELNRRANISFQVVSTYLDEEHARRVEWEQQVEARLRALEAK